VPYTFRSTRVDLQEVTTRNEIARQIIAGFSTATPTLTEIWQHLDTALADTPILCAEVSRLLTELAGIQRDHADLLAAARATVTACGDAETDPLFYLRDELSAHGQLPPNDRGRG
jgi:hypothetical protein